MKKFVWTDFYSEFATSLLKYAPDRTKLIEMIKDSDTPENYKVDFHVGLNRYDEIIALIQSLIHIGEFNEEYLNDLSDE